MDRTLLWQSIAVVAICVGFAYKDFRITARGTFNTLMCFFILVGTILGTVLVVNYVFSAIWS
jgi:hypothetical protein